MPDCRLGKERREETRDFFCCVLLSALSVSVIYYFALHSWPSKLNMLVTIFINHQISLEHLTVRFVLLLVMYIVQ